MAPSAFCCSSLFTLLLSLVAVPICVVMGDACDIAEYPCDDGGCVTISYFCDGVAHCRDYSDEPPGCSVCNRTYYGYLDKSYSLVIPSAPALRSHSRASSLNFPVLVDETRKISADWNGKPESSDFICLLTFVAAGQRHGDVVQINFDDFHVGHFNVTGAEGGGVDGCSADHVTIEEPTSVYRGGRWCGEGVGLNVYFSETNSIVLTLKATTATFGEYFDNPLRFKLKYKFLAKDESIVRYGTYKKKKFRGELVRNTGCSRVFQGCRARTCKIQSPNYPGLYPRNLTCYYLIKALPAPSDDLVPVIVLSQTNDRLMQIGQREPSSRVSPEAILKQNQDCINPEDYVLVYDGGAMRFPLLSKFCGTAKLTNITSSGPEMLVVFRSAASGQMNHLANLATGFEFDIHILFMRRNPNAITSEECEENIKSFGTTSGVIKNPPYAMPANSSCRYNFYGQRNEIVWIYFTKYHRVSEHRVHPGEVACKNRLRITDGTFGNDTSVNDSVTLGEYCEDQTPPLCVRSREKGFLARPCAVAESFMSRSQNVFISQEFTESTSLKTLEYVIHYEFVNVQEMGPFILNSSCDRQFDSSVSKRGHITAPKSVFFYGRGGRTNLFCKYKFISRIDEAIKLNIVGVTFPDRLCKTVHNSETNIYDCIARITGSAIMEVFEMYWNNTKLILGCICDNRLRKVNFISYSNVVELDFVIKLMTWSQDNSDFQFDAEYEFVSIKNCSLNRDFNGTNGVIRLGSFLSHSSCEHFPWKISTKNTHHIYLNIPGYHGTSQQCQTSNRIVIYDTETGRPIKAVCPSSDSRESIDVFSSGWNSHLEWPRVDPVNIVFKYIPREEGDYKLKWLEVTREPRPSALESLQGGGWKDKGLSSCDNECPEIGACINKDLWCDGVPHCPSGADEEKSSCIYASIPWMYVVLITVSFIGLFFGSVVVFVAVRVFQKGKLKRKKRKEAQRLMTQEVLLPMTFHKKDNIENIYLRGGI